MTPAVFLDRDGTLLEECGYLDRLDRAVLFPWAVDAVRTINRAGYRVVVVTNQSGIARGLVDESFVGELHAHLARVFAAGRASIDAFYYCPHLPDAPLAAYRRACDCRKPAPGMLTGAAADLGLDLARSFVIGDRWIDIELALRAGARGVLVRSGYGASEEVRPRPGVEAVHVADNLMHAAGWLLLQQR
jgi:D-glycero-D-manno-heptose 1,7-bisphosphate phosphatase